MKAGEYVSVYGCYGVDKGTYSWQIRLTMPTSARYFCLGIIEDKPGILERYKEDYEYYREHGCLLFYNGYFHRVDYIGKRYMPEYLGAGNTKITMTLDKESHSLSYIINGKNYGIATNTLNKSKYRMVITLCHTNHEVELL